MADGCSVAIFTLGAFDHDEVAERLESVLTSLDGHVELTEEYDDDVDHVTRNAPETRPITPEIARHIVETDVCAPGC